MCGNVDGFCLVTWHRKGVFVVYTLAECGLKSLRYLFYHRRCCNSRILADKLVRQLFGRHVVYELRSVLQGLFPLATLASERMKGHPVCAQHLFGLYFSLYIILFCPVVSSNVSRFSAMKLSMWRTRFSSKISSTAMRMPVSSTSPKP